jgi:hypothetical protein
MLHTSGPHDDLNYSYTQDSLCYELAANWKGYRGTDMDVDPPPGLAVTINFQGKKN